MSTHAAGTPTDVVAPAFESPAFTPVKTGAAVAHSLFVARRSEGLAAAKPARIPATPAARSAANDPPVSVPTLMESPLHETYGSEDRFPGRVAAAAPHLTWMALRSSGGALESRKIALEEKDPTPEGTLRAAPGFPPRGRTPPSAARRGREPPGSSSSRRARDGRSPPSATSAWRRSRPSSRSAGGARRGRGSRPGRGRTRSRAAGRCG